MVGVIGAIRMVIALPFYLVGAILLAIGFLIGPREMMKGFITAMKKHKDNRDEQR